MAETVKTADASGTVKTQSPQEDPKPKAAKASPPAKRAATPGKPELGAQGRPVTKFSDAALNPNERKHVGEDPTGESNVSK